MDMQKIDIKRLVPMDMFLDDFPLRIALAYAQKDNFCGQAIYRSGARLWLYDDVALTVLLAGKLAQTHHDSSFVLYDGLRTVDAQARIRSTDIVQAHPHWMEGEHRVLSNPGQGAHPRGMAVDLSMIDQDDRLWDMGTAFDELPEGDSGPDTNKAHRQYQDLSQEVKDNRAALENIMLTAASMLGLSLHPLQSEWWDYRLPLDVVKRYEPLDEKDLPPQMHMTGANVETTVPDFSEDHFESLKQNCMARVNQFL